MNSSGTRKSLSCLCVFVFVLMQRCREFTLKVLNCAQLLRGLKVMLVTQANWCCALAKDSPSLVVKVKSCVENHPLVFFSPKTGNTGSTRLGSCPRGTLSASYVHVEWQRCTKCFVSSACHRDEPTFAAAH